MPREIDSWIVKTSSVVPEYLCAQSAESLAMSISFVVTRSDDPLRRTDPSSKYCTPRFAAMSASGSERPLRRMLDVREMTRSARTLDRSVMISSVSPSAK